jgi:hypothetical protein
LAVEVEVLSGDLKNRQTSFAAREAKLVGHNIGQLWMEICVLENWIHLLIVCQFATSFGPLCVQRFHDMAAQSRWVLRQDVSPPLEKS